MIRRGRGLLAALILLLPLSCGRGGAYHTFADYPGFAELFAERCRTEAPPPANAERALLERYRPRFFLPPGGRYPIDFNGDYLPFATLRRHPGGELLAPEVTAQLLQQHRSDRSVYLDFDLEAYRAAGRDRRVGRDDGAQRAALYGRVIREDVSFPLPEGGAAVRELTFLKYNLVFAMSGLAEELPLLHRIALALTPLDAEDWHELDNFVAVHVVLDEGQQPVALLLAQHNHHRTYLAGRDIPLPRDGRFRFDVARRSNEVYPASDSTLPVRHRVARRGLEMAWLLSGEEAPFFRGHDLTWGQEAGAAEARTELVVLSPCDPFYTAEILLGEPRPFFGAYIGRDGPPGADYYTIPDLMPLGRLLKASYLQDGDGDDIALVRTAIDRRKGRIDVERIARHGGESFFADWQGLGDAAIP